MKAKSKSLMATLAKGLLGLAAISFLIGGAVAQDGHHHELGELSTEAASKLFPTKPPYSPYSGLNFPSRPLFGDTHLHTSFSMDAGAFGCRLTPSDAYRFAKGQEVVAANGMKARLSRPLDFLVVADHSDGFGFFSLVLSGDPIILANERGRRWYNMIQEGRGGEASVEIIRGFSTGDFPMEIFPKPGNAAYQRAWEQTIKAAEDANDPGRFTAFIGWEWSSNTLGNNLHRNVIYRDGADKAIRMEPYTTIEPLGSDNPVDLWKWMEQYESTTGGKLLAIAHNGNLSNGRMFPVVEAFGEKIDRSYAETRLKWERLYEVTQIKGDGETHPYLSPNDEFADFETWDKGNLDLSSLKEDSMLEYEYARAALKNGLAMGRRLGVNPYKFGMVGSTDSHTALATAEEENFFGKHSGSEPGEERLAHPFIVSHDKTAVITGWETSASGYAAVWASENTRESIFDAMMRRETYATTGPRMVVRFFGGWEFQPEDANTRMPAKVGYTKGVPMGGELNAAPEGKAPSFLVAAMKDPIGANLDRIQVVKGWLDANGEPQEKVFNVVWSGDRKADAQGNLPLIGSTVDVENATWANTIGTPELITVWTDPEFDPALDAFYYLRVLEIPTPRWTAYDQKYFGNVAPENVPMEIVERAYTSPIWYNAGS